jgi:hypothetical protein
MGLVVANVRRNAPPGPAGPPSASPPIPPGGSKPHPG